MVDKLRLKSELGVFYSRRDIQTDNLVALRDFFQKNQLDQVFFEVSKVIDILISTPMTTSEPERKFSTLDRIKTKLRSTMSNSRLNALSILSMEKEMIRSSQDKNFQDLVIEDFVNKKQRRLDFIYQ